MNQITAEIIEIPKGNKTLVEAFKELDLVKEAFLRSSRIEEKILKNESAISEIRSRLEVVSTYSYVDTKTEKLQSMIDTMVKAKFDEYTSHILFEINRKANDSDLKKLLELKVNWPAFIELQRTYGGIKLKLDSHVDSEFLSYKLRVEEEFKKQQELIQSNYKFSTDEIKDLKLKFEDLLVKVQEVLADEEISKEDQSEEDFEKMMDDLENQIIPPFPYVKSPEKLAQRRDSNEIPMLFSKSPTKNLSYKESKSPLVGFIEPERLERRSTEIFGDAFSPSYRKSKQETCTRKNSIASSITGGGGIKQIGRKVATMEKDITDIYQEIQNFTKKFKEFDREIQQIHEKIIQINKRCDQIEEFEKKMESTFVSRLRNKDMQNKLKKDKVLIEKIPDNELLKLNKEISEKNKRIMQMDHCLKYLITEIDYLKSNQNSKFKDFQQSLECLERDNKNKDKEFNSLKTNFSQIECNLSENINKNIEEIFIPRPVYSASIRARENDSKIKIRRKSQDSTIHLKEELNKLIEMTEKIPIKNNYRGKSITPKVRQQTKAFLVDKL